MSLGPFLIDLHALGFCSHGNFLQLLRGWELVLLLLHASLNGTEGYSTLLLLQYCQDISASLCWDFCWGRYVQRQKTSHFSLPLVPVQMMLYTHHEICTALYILKIAPLLKQVKAVTVASFSLLIRSLYFKYSDFAEVQGVFLYQVPPLACTQQQRFSMKFQDQLFFFLWKGKETYSNWQDHYLKDYFLWRLSNTWIFTCLFSDLLGLQVNIQKSHLLPPSSLDFEGFQVI